MKPSTQITVTKMGLLFFIVPFKFFTLFKLISKKTKRKKLTWLGKQIIT